MSKINKLFAGCLVLPVILIASCAGRNIYNMRMYNLPGEVLKSSARPTRHLVSAMQVAETLDDYVQPRFEILRDNNFGINRITYRKHAGIVQLKVDTPQEQELIANVNAAHREYAISLLHCAPKPTHAPRSKTPNLQLLYFNQQQIASSWAFDQSSLDESKEADAKNRLNWDLLEKKAIAALPQLMKGKEHRFKVTSWEILMRPVLASKQECRSCHTNEKPDSTLGVMVYAVKADSGNHFVSESALHGERITDYLDD